MRPGILEARKRFERDVLLTPVLAALERRQRPPARGGARRLRRVVLQGTELRPATRGHDRRRQRPRVRIPLEVRAARLENGVPAAPDGRSARRFAAPGHPARQLLPHPGRDPKRRHPAGVAETPGRPGRGRPVGGPPRGRPRSWTWPAPRTTRSACETVASILRRSADEREAILRAIGRNLRLAARPGVDGRRSRPCQAGGCRGRPSAAAELAGDCATTT